MFQQFLCGLFCFGHARSDVKDEDLYPFSCVLMRCLPSEDVISVSVIIFRWSLQLFIIFRVLESLVNLEYASMRKTSFFCCKEGCH